MDAISQLLPIVAGIGSVLLLASLGLDYVRAGKLAPFLTWFRRENADADDSTLPPVLDRMETLRDLERVRERAIAAGRMDLRREVDEAAATLFRGEPEQ